MGINALKEEKSMWHNIWMEYVKDWHSHSKEQIVLQILSIVIILVFGMIAIRLMGKKSITQMTLTDILFIFILSTTLGALITKPNRVFIALMVVVTICVFIYVIEKLQVKINLVERLLISLPETVYQEGKWFEVHMRRNNITVDLIESVIRQRGYPSVHVCKTITIEPTGALAFELLPEYEPVKKIYFDEAVKQILKAIDSDLEYKEAVIPPMNNAFEEIERGALAQQKNPVPKILE
jgi:uncharacterized membrane protein YcaP (DUF421 family)